MSLIVFRQKLNTFHSQVLKLCQFTAVAGLVRVRCSNFKEISKVCPSCPWVKCCLIIHLYFATRDDRSGGASGNDQGCAITFADGKEKFAKNISTKTMAELCYEVAFVQRFESFLFDTLMHYS